VGSAEHLLSATGPNQYDEKSQLGQEKYLYSYVLSANRAELEFLVTVQPAASSPDCYDFSLALKVDGVGRAIGEPVALRLAVNPDGLHFSVFVFPPKASLPEGCLHSLRVWLSINGIDHRLFAEDELWVARDPNFSTIENASFTHSVTQSSDPNLRIYQGVVGRAHVNFLVRWTLLHENAYQLSLEYEAGGVGRILFDDICLCVDCDISTISFVIYTIPMASTPEGASHRLRFWICTPIASSARLSSDGTSSYTCQRLWKSDAFKIGALLDFESLGTSMVMGQPRPGRINPQVISS